MKPLIAFSCNHNPVYHPDGYYVLGPHFYVYSDYIRPIAELGGAPCIIPVLQNEDYYRDSLRNAQGLVLVGGVDVNPFLFDQKIEKGLRKVSPDMDYGEIEMIKIALEMDIPILAICRGIQILNLVIGGTIHQDIADSVPNVSKHYTEFPPNTFAHWVTVERDSKLFGIVKETKIPVNSAHHQAVNKPGGRAVVVAHADDGIIEAIEIPDRKWVLGVQWHPEQIWRQSKIHTEIFKAFLDACKTA
jgi:putative glutamine amidotransferase